MKSMILVVMVLFVPYYGLAMGPGLTPNQLRIDTLNNRLGILTADINTLNKTIKRLGKSSPLLNILNQKRKERDRFSKQSSNYWLAFIGLNVASTILGVVSAYQFVRSAAYRMPEVEKTPMVFNSTAKMIFKGQHPAETVLKLELYGTCAAVGCFGLSISGFSCLRRSWYFWHKEQDAVTDINDLEGYALLNPQQDEQVNEAEA